MSFHLKPNKKFGFEMSRKYSVFILTTNLFFYVFNKIVLLQ